MECHLEYGHEKDQPEHRHWFEEFDVDGRLVKGSVGWREMGEEVSRDLKEERAVGVRMDSVFVAANNRGEV